jgi:plasmid stabilization system protein ParE
LKRVLWSAHAKVDLERAVAYRAVDSIGAAEALDIDIRTAASLLAELNSGRPGRVAGTFEKIVWKQRYIILFETDDSEVRVLRIVHGSRYWPQGAWPPESG